MNRGRSVWLKMSLVFLGIMIIYAMYYYFLYSGFSEDDQSAALNGVRSGGFGDAFGALNALFSGMAFAGVVVTLYLQRIDISEGQREIALQQAEAARQKEESQFYNMLSLQQGVVRGFDLHKSADSFSSDVIQGRDCFKTWSSQLTTRYKVGIKKTGVPDLAAAYEEIWRLHRGDLSIYYRSLYSVFKFISSSGHADKRWLGNVARSLVSDYELVILFYNCLSSKGSKFKAFANEFALFDNLDPKLLLEENHVLQLDIEAYGQNEEVLVIYRSR